MGGGGRHTSALIITTYNQVICCKRNACGIGGIGFVDPLYIELHQITNKAREGIFFH